MVPQNKIIETITPHIYFSFNHTLIITDALFALKLESRVFSLTVSIIHG